MSQELTELKKRAAAMSAAERAELAMALIESLDGPENEGVEEAWRVELDRRSDEIRRGEARLVDGDEVMDRIWHRVG